MDDLLTEIDAFCAAHDMSPSRFGELAMNDKPFVTQLREGRDIRFSTAQRIRTFMAEYRPSEAA
ncbi:MAG: hypothetical protein ABGX08_17310 [Citromicrobium sp.]